MLIWTCLSTLWNNIKVNLKRVLLFLYRIIIFWGGEDWCQSQWFTAWWRCWWLEPLIMIKRQDENKVLRKHQNTEKTGQNSVNGQKIQEKASREGCVILLLCVFSFLFLCWPKIVEITWLSNFQYCRHFVPELIMKPWLCPPSSKVHLHEKITDCKTVMKITS